MTAEPRYEIVTQLASGGMGEVWLGRMRAGAAPRPVAVKRILPSHAMEPDYREMFEEEAFVALRVDHPNVASAYEVDCRDGQLLLVMEYLHGESLLELMRQLWADGEPLDPALAAFIVMEACAGLDAVHDVVDDAGVPLGIVHRDVSPQNVFVSYDGRVTIIDFGVAGTVDRRAAEPLSGCIRGKLGYMSPEQIHSFPLDRRSDVYGLGAILWELTTNRRLFPDIKGRGGIATALARHVVAPSQVVPEYPASLERVCMKALATLPSARYQSAAAMRDDLGLVVEELGGPAAPPAALAAKLRQVFADRVAWKNGLVERALAVAPRLAG